MSLAAQNEAQFKKWAEKLKSATDTAEIEQGLEALSALQTNPALLGATKIGACVNRLSQRPDLSEKLRKDAANLVAQWRQMAENAKGYGGINRTLPRQVLVLARFNDWAGVKISPGATSLCTRSRTATASGQGGSGDGGGQEEVAGMEVEEQDEETGSGDPAEPEGDDTANGPPLALPLPREVKETGSFNDWAGVKIQPGETGVYTRGRRALLASAETGDLVLLLPAADSAELGESEGVEGQGDEETDHQTREEDKDKEGTDAQRVVKKPRGLKREVMETQQFADWWGASGDLAPRLRGQANPLPLAVVSLEVPTEGEEEEEEDEEMNGEEEGPEEAAEAGDEREGDTGGVREEEEEGGDAQRVKKVPMWRELKNVQAFEISWGAPRVEEGDGEMRDKDEAAEEQSEEPADSAGRGGPSEAAASGNVEMDRGAPSVRRCARLKGVPRRSTKPPGLSLEYFLEGEEKDSEKVRVTKEPGKGKGLLATDTIEKDETVAVVIGVPVVVEKADHPLRGMSDDLKARLRKVFPRGAYVWVGRVGEKKRALVYFVHYDSPDKRFRDLSTYVNVASGGEKGTVYMWADAGSHFPALDEEMERIGEELNEGGVEDTSIGDWEAKGPLICGYMKAKDEIKSGEFID